MLFLFCNFHAVLHFASENHASRAPILPISQLSQDTAFRMISDQASKRGRV
jgi:hypothetical protein